MPDNYFDEDTTHQNLKTDPTIISAMDLEGPLKSMFIVGNGKMDKGMASVIDKADVVIRFNDMLNYDLGTGTKQVFGYFPVIMKLVIK